MNTRKFLIRSFVYHRKSHIWVILGTMLSTAILVGALVIGDSVRFSLRRIVFDRLGKTELALTSGDRLFRLSLAAELERALNTSVVPLLQTKGIAIAAGGQERVNRIQIIGMDERFGSISRSKHSFPVMASNEAVVNIHLAKRLGLNPGQELLLRFTGLSAVPGDTPLAMEKPDAAAGRFRIKAVAEDAALGRFSLKSDQLAPDTVFLNITALSRILGTEDKANVLLIGEGPDTPVLLDTARNALRKTWKPEDAGLVLTSFTYFLQIESDQIFLKPLIFDTLKNNKINTQGILTYFVNEMRLGTRSTPYSFVTAPGSPIIPNNMADQEIIINRWLADDLAAEVGDKIKLKYYVPGPGRHLAENEAVFKIIQIVPLAGKYSDKYFLPNFPGLAEVNNCRDWDPGIPIDLDKIRSKDEEYWNSYQGTPKAYISLSAAQKMWSNRFGSLTAIRIPGSDRATIENILRNQLEPEKMGFVFREVKKEGLRASDNAVSFSQLFLGLSFFIILASLLLTMLLFAFNAENRSAENGLMLALGFTQKKVRSLIFAEALWLLSIGSLLGGITGIVYNQIILAALKTVWRGAVGTAALQLHIRPLTLGLGIILGAGLTFLSLWRIVRTQVKRSITSLQKGAVKLDRIKIKRSPASIWIGISALTAAAGLLVTANVQKRTGLFAFFFAAGVLLLISAVAFSNNYIIRLATKTRSLRLNPVAIGIRNNSRKRFRSLTMIGLLASGLFIVFTVGANRTSSHKNAAARASGTGGFALYGESTLSILQDLNSPAGKRVYGLDHGTDTAISYVQMRLKEGDDASCLNLNQVAHPHLVGVDPEKFAARAAFTFAAAAPGVDQENPWAILDQILPDGSIPAVADQSVIIWGLGKSVGDSIAYLDETGQEYNITLVGGLANSIFQGKIIISEQAFINRYPSISGYRVFLIDAPIAVREQVSRDIVWALQDTGLDLVSTADRLAQFNQVSNTYLSIFLILGSFGLILGSFGIAILIGRSVKERKNELALMQALGIPNKAIQIIILSEHLLQLGAGVFFGLSSALLASLPALKNPGVKIPYLTILVVLLVILSSGILWSYLATTWALKKDLIPALRNE